MTKPSGGTMSLVVRLVLPLKIIIDGKINPSAATVRMTVTCLFLEPGEFHMKHLLQEEIEVIIKKEISFTVE